MTDEGERLPETLQEWAKMTLLLSFLGIDPGAFHLCLHCGWASNHPQDVANDYCGACHHFCSDVDSAGGHDDHSVSG